MNCSEILHEEAARTLVVCAASSFNWALLITPAVISVSVFVAYLGVKSARSTARQRATLDMIEKVEPAPHYRDLHAVFAYHRRRNSFHRLHDPVEEKDKKERQAVLDYLNHYELVSIGIRKKILDAEIYKDWMLSAFVRDWNVAAGFIDRERWKFDQASGKWEYHAPVFENYQAVAEIWSPDDAVRLTKENSTPPEAPSGPGDEALPKTDAAKSDGA